MDPTGRSLAWLNSPDNHLITLPSTIPNQIKFSEGLPRSSYRWATVNGDGRVDFLAIDAVTGNLTVWINLGTTPSLTSGMSWHRQDGTWMPGVERVRMCTFRS